MPLRRPLLLALTLVPCSGCATMATEGRVARVSAGMTTRSAKVERRVFVAQVSGAGEGESRPSLAPAVAASSAWGTVRIVVSADDRLEYLATFYNPRGETLTGASLLHRGSDALAAQVGTLFAGVALRSPYIQLRGTVSIARERRASVLSEELRERPRTFMVRVFTAGGPSNGTLRGVVE